MLGAIIGNIIGSSYTAKKTTDKDFSLFNDNSQPMRDTIMTVAVGLVTASPCVQDEASYKRELIRFLTLLGKEYPDFNYGIRFNKWLEDEEHRPYRSYGNDAASRVSAIGWRAKTLDDALRMAKWSAEVTHDHVEGIRGAQAIASAVFLARTQRSKRIIKGYVSSMFYPLDTSLEMIRLKSRFDETCQCSVPHAIQCFLDSNSYEDAVRNAILLGEDAGAQACIAGAIAEAYYGGSQAIDRDILVKGLNYLDPRLKKYALAYCSRLYGA